MKLTSHMPFFSILFSMVLQIESEGVAADRPLKAPEPQPSAARAPAPPAGPAWRRFLGEELLEAAQGGRLREVRWLLDAGADPNYRGDFRWTPLMQASWRGHAAVASLLLQRGASVHAATGAGWTALHYAAQNDYSGLCVAPLVAAGARVDGRGYPDWTPLHAAAASDNEAAAWALVAAGASKTLMDEEGRTPLDLAYSEAVRFILRS